jgi:hypothetical protein
MAEQSGSILAADFGNVHTRVILFDLVDGAYRMVAQGQAGSTAGYPAQDVRAGLARAVEQISEFTGRRLLSQEGLLITPENADRSGVDDFLATASTGRSLRTVVIGLVPGVSVASAIRAAAGTYVQILTTITLEDNHAEEEHLNEILRSSPDLIFITGGLEGGAQEPVLKLARTVSLAIKLMQRKPVILYAGNSALEPMIRSLFEGQTTVLVAPNVRPTLEREQLESAQLQLALAFNEQQANKGGYGPVGQMSRLGVLPTAQSYSLIADYLGKTVEGGVLILDVGSAVSTLAASLKGRVSTTIRTDIGVGHSAVTLLDLAGEDAVRRWLPFVDAKHQIRHYALNKTLRPATIPESLKGVYLEHALLRVGAETLLGVARPSWSTLQHAEVSDQMPPFAVIIGAGAPFTRTGTPGFGALLLLDALQPVGAVRMYTDPYGLVAALGALARVRPEAVVQILDGSSLDRLGTAFCVEGLPPPKGTALKVKITLDTGEVVKHDVPAGHLWVYPLNVNHAAEVEVRAGRGLKIGGRSKLKMTAVGGSCGLLFDGRGRPLPLVGGVRMRGEMMPQWMAEITGEPLKPIDPSWLLVASDEDDSDDRPDDTLNRKGLFGRGKDGKAAKAKSKAKDQKKPRRGLFGRRKNAPARSDDLPEPDLDTFVDDELPDFSDDSINNLDDLRRS